MRGMSPWRNSFNKRRASANELKCRNDNRFDATEQHRNTSGKQMRLFHQNVQPDIDDMRIEVTH